MADPKQPPDSPPTDDDVLAMDAEIFVEGPTVPAAPGLVDEAAGFEAVPMIAEPLPEMASEIWQAGVAALVTAADGAEPVAPAAEDWAWEARLLRDEAVLAESPTEAAVLLAAAGRAALRAGDPESAEGFLDAAVDRAPAAPDVVRARARLAEAKGDFAGAELLWGRLAGLVENPEEASAYAALHVEWRLARLGAVPPVALQSLPAGPARALAAAEVALRRGAAGDVATAMAEAGRNLGGVVGAVLMEQAARFTETAVERGRAAELRADARALVAAGGEETTAGAGLFGRLREAARTDERQAAALLATLADELEPTSALGFAVRRAAAAAARRQHDTETAGRLLAELPPVTAAAARERIDFAVETGEALDAASLERLGAEFPGAAGAAALAWVEAASLAARGAHASALAVAERGLEINPDAVPLGLVAEQVASELDGRETEMRAAALELWLRADPGRRADAALALAELREADRAPQAATMARAALQTAVEAAPGSALFWIVASADARAGRSADAAATLAYGAEAWGGSALGAPLQALAAAHLARVDPHGALGLLDWPGAAAGFGAEARARLAARAGDREAHATALAEAAANNNHPDRRAALEVQRALFATDSDTRAVALASALRAIPDHPLALALLSVDDSIGPETLAAALWQAAETTSALGLATWHRLAATFVADTEDPEAALRYASELARLLPTDRLAQLALGRAAARLDPEGRARTVSQLPADPASDPVAALQVAEASVDVGDEGRAAALFRALGPGRFGAEARRALARLGAEGEPGIPPGLLVGAPDDKAAVVRSDVGNVLAMAREGDWPAVIAALERRPPHEGRAGTATLHTLALLAEARGLVQEAARLDGAAVRTAGPRAVAAPLPSLGRVVEHEGFGGFDPGAFELAAARFSMLSEPLAVASLQGDLARLREAVGEPEEAREAWRAALNADARFLPAALALRREAAGRGDVDATIDAAETEAASLDVAAERVRALLLAAALAEEAAKGGASSGAAEDGGPTATTAAAALRARALRLLCEALQIDPGHDGAFEQLRSVLEQQGDAPGLVAALEARIGVAKNPFEVTSLRLARADVLAGKLADPAAARAELDAILQRQPEHPRALARLAELHWDAEAWNEAGEVYLRRAMVERHPRKLREIFLRLGHIYIQRTPDPQRAIAAYERVRALEPNNQEAVRALSDLYVAEGNAKAALPVTEQAVRAERDVARQTALRVRLADLLVKSGDLRAATAELRRAVDVAPRDLPAVTALAQVYERSRDVAARRNHLDHSVGILRRDLERGEIDLGGLRSLASLLGLRGSPIAAGCAAGLVAAFGSGKWRGGEGAAARHLGALRRPEVDERAYPPGLPPGIRQIMRLVGPLYRPSGAELARHLAEHGLTRGERLGRGIEPRPVFEAVAAELGTGEFDVYVKGRAAQGAPAALRAEPGSPAAIVLGAEVVELGAAAQRFAAARTLRLVATGLDVLLARTPEEAAALLAAVIRLFVPEYRHPAIREALVEAEAADAARLISRKLRSQIMPFAVESAGPFDVAGLHAAVRSSANIAGLLAAGDLPAALSVILVASGAPSRAGLTLAAVAGNPEALSLARYAVSDDYDALARTLGEG